MNQPANPPLYDWLNSFPQESQSRLYQINHASTSASHIVLALGYGIYDSHIRKLNRLIIGLMLSRMKAERSDNDAVIANINKTLQDLHDSINRVTGLTPVVPDGACQSPAKRKASRVRETRSATAG